MNLIRCRWVASNEPRAIIDRHLEDCTDTECKGCLECPLRHCLVCGVAHVTEQTCPACIGATRSDLANIVHLYGHLFPQAVLAGNDGRLNAAAPIPGGEALVMRSPGARGDQAHDLRSKGLDASHVDDERHNEQGPPLLVLATWEDDWRIVFMHGEGPRITSVEICSDYLSRNLDRAAQEHLAFDDFASGIRQLLDRIERVLHNENRGDYAGVACFDCGGALERKLTDHGLDDRWTCRRCRRVYTDPEYGLAVRAKIETAMGSA